ncbi:MAG: Wzt carbohydrate-binding domain-containing protein [Gallintestinimicrobium sp.]
MQTTAILKGDEFTMHMKVKIGQDLPAPIFAFPSKTSRAWRSRERTRCLKKTFLESVKAGQVLEITFRQKMRLQGGDYLISLGVTGMKRYV